MRNNTINVIVGAEELFLAATDLRRNSAGIPANCIGCPQFINEAGNCHCRIMPKLKAGCAIRHYNKLRQLAKGDNDYASHVKD